MHLCLLYQHKALIDIVHYPGNTVVMHTGFQAKKTPLHMGAQNGQIEVCSTLLKLKSDANATDVVGI